MGDEEGMEVEVEQARKPPVMLESVSKKIQLKAFLAHTKQKFSNIVGLPALRLTFFMGYE